MDKNNEKEAYDKLEKRITLLEDLFSYLKEQMTCAKNRNHHLRRRIEKQKALIRMEKLEKNETVQ